MDITLLDLFLAGFVVYLVFQMGKHWGFYKISQQMLNNPEAMTELLARVRELSIEDPDSDKGTEMSIERVGDQLYAYAKDTGQFLGQAGDLDALTQIVSKRFPEQTFFGTITADNPAKELVK